MVAASSELGVLVFVVLCLSIQTGCLTSQRKFNEQVALFIFGDSLFDPGNNNYINTTTGFQANYWPYGQSYFNPLSGRFSDGRLIPDFIAEYARLPLIPAYLQPENNGFTHGANFASGGAGALIDSHAGFVIDLHTQLHYFHNLENHYRKSLGDTTKAQKLLSNAVYLFSCGANDYQRPGVNDLSIFHPYTHEEYVDMVIGNYTTVIKGIYEKGGRKYGFVTAPLIGCWPGIRLRQPGNRCSEEIDDITRLHNQVLGKKLEDLEKELKGFMYAKFDISTSIDNRMKNPSKYGFKEGEIACCGGGPFRGIYSCGGMRAIEEYEVCDNASEYLFFDSFHPNEVASRQFAELFWNGDSKITRPYNLKTFFEGVTNDEL